MTAPRPGRGPGAEDGTTVVRLWEARVAPGALAAVTGWLRDDVLPVAVAAGALRAEVLAGDADPTRDQPDRVVLAVWWPAAGVPAEGGCGVPGAPPAPVGGVARSHAWDFRAVAARAGAPGTALG